MGVGIARQSGSWLMVAWQGWWRRWRCPERRPKVCWDSERYFTWYEILLNWNSAFFFVQKIKTVFHFIRILNNWIYVVLRILIIFESSCDYVVVCLGFGNMSDGSVISTVVCFVSCVLGSVYFGLLEIVCLVCMHLEKMSLRSKFSIFLLWVYSFHVDRSSS